MKRVELTIEVDKTGKIIVTPKGTVGKECLDLMAFLDQVESFSIETIPNEDMNSTHTISITKKVQINEHK